LKFFPISLSEKVLFFLTFDFFRLHFPDLLPLPPREETPSRVRRDVRGVGATHVDGVYSIHTNAQRRLDLLELNTEHAVKVVQQKAQEAAAKVFEKNLIEIYISFSFVFVLYAATCYIVHGSDVIKQ